MKALCSELKRALKAIRQPEDHDAMAQAYEAYTEAIVCDEFCRRGVVLERTPGTGDYRQKRPDFIHRAAAGEIYVEVKALEIADRLTRHGGIAQEALGIAVDLDTRARTPGVHFGEPHVISGHLPGTRAAGRVDETIKRIHNVVKLDQIEYGPTILVVDLGRLAGMPYGPSGLLPVFFHDEPHAESCVSGKCGTLRSASLEKDSSSCRNSMARATLGKSKQSWASFGNSPHCWRSPFCIKVGPSRPNSLPSGTAGGISRVWLTLARWTSKQSSSSCANIPTV